MSAAKATKKKARPANSTPAEPGAPRTYWGVPLHEWCTAAGLGILIYWRPWQDGMVFPASNPVFLLGIMALFGFWAAHGLVRGSANVALIPTLLIAGFLIVAWLTGFGSVQYYATQVALTNWCGYAMVFVLAASLRSGTAMGFVLAFVVVTSTAEALFSIIHLKYSLPETRVYVQNDPKGAENLFRNELNAALVHRLNSNRAFGTLLFANGLASWLVATIPLSFFGVWNAVQKLRSNAGPLDSPSPLARGLVIGAVAAAVSIPVLSAAQTITALMNIPFSDVVIGFPFSPLLMRVPVPSIVVVLVQIAAIAATLGVYAVLALLLKPSNKPGEEMNAHAMIAAVFTTAVLCVSLAVLYSRFHFFYFAEQVTTEEGMQFVRASLYEPLLPFLFCVLVVPIAGAGAAIRIARKRGPAVLVWSALCVLFSVGALAQCAALWMTYSRGGLMALSVGLIAAVVLYRKGRMTPENAARLKAVAAGLLFMLASAALVTRGDVHAQEPDEDTVNPFVKEIEVKGEDMTVGDLLNPKTVSLRFKYWVGALDMAADNWATGVGLGNFGAAYPQYQPLGNSDTKQAHNDFLQVFCETGVIGFGFFVAFWAWFAIQGGRRLRASADADGRWLLAGLYACVCGFLVHAFVDFPIEDPALAMLAFLLAGLFWAKTSSETPATIGIPARAIATAGLVAVFAVFGLNARLGHVDAVIGTEQVRQERVSIASQLVKGIETPPNEPPSVPDRVIAQLIEDPGTRRAFGMHYFHPRPGDPTWAPLPPGSPIPRDALLVLTNMPLVMSKAKEASAGWTTRIAEADAVFPYDPEIAFQLSLWFDMLWRSGDSPQDGLAYIKQAVEWAEKAIDRNPRQVAYHDWLFKMRWRQALSEPLIEDQVRYFELCLDAIDRTVELYPIKPQLWDTHALMYRWASEKFESLGRPDLAEACTAVMNQSEAKAAEIRAELLKQQEEEES